MLDCCRLPHPLEDLHVLFCDVKTLLALGLRVCVHHDCCVKTNRVSSIMRVENHVIVLTNKEVLQDENRNEVVQKEEAERPATVAIEFICDHLPVFS